MVDSEKQKEEKELNSQYKAFNYDNSPKSKEEFWENEKEKVKAEVIKEEEKNKPEEKGIIVKTVPSTHFPNSYKLERSEYH
jgi:hypothetical protein